MRESPKAKGDRERLIPSLSSKDILAVWAVAEDSVLSIWNLREIRDVLHGEVLWGEELLDRPVRRMTVGSTPLQGGSVLFKRVYNKIVFLDGLPSERDTETPVPSESVAGILLNSGVRPPPQIIVAAAGENMPLLLAKEDTFAVRERLERDAHHSLTKMNPKFSIMQS